MDLLLHLPLAIHERGARPHNEDAIYPQLGEADISDRLFLVCDGVGGAEKGEIASRLACQEFARFFQEIVGAGVSNQQLIDRALERVELTFDQYLERNPQARGMATTLCLLHLHKDGATIAHIGDSRLYHMRQGKILWQSQDHTLVNQLLNKGALTEQEAENHPHQHIITRAIQGLSEKKTWADVHLIRDIRAGDYLFLCSDGILENFSDDALVYFITSTRGNAEILEGIRQKCLGNPNDNFSAYLIHIEQVDGAETSTPMAYPIASEEVEATVVDPGEGTEIVDAIIEQNEDGTNDSWNYTYATKT